MSQSSHLPASLVGTGDMFQLLRDGEPRTKAELGELTSLSRSTVTARVEAMLAVGLLRPVGDGLPTGGRPATRFALDAGSRVVLAVDLGASHASVAIVDLAGSVLAERTEACDIADGPRTTLDRVVGWAGGLLDSLHRTVGDVAAVGIGLPGPVEHATGRPANPPIMPGWHDFDVPGHLRRSIDAPVLVDNDVNLMALGEYSSVWPDEHLLLIKVATGIGAGIVSDGRLLRGALGSAGDLGHIRAVEGGAEVVCRCGNAGCLEAVAAAPAIAASLRDQGVDVSGAQGVVDAVVAGEIAAIQALREAGRHLGAVVATCVNLLNPSVVVVAGKMSEAGEYLLAGVREVVYQRSLPLATNDLRIVGTALAGRGGVLGASAMAIDAVLSPASIDAFVAASVADRPA